MIVDETAVDVWVESLDRPPQDVAALGELLSVDERERSQSFVFPEHRRRYVVARGLLRTILGRELGCNPRDLRFEYGRHGKPTLRAPAPRRVRFNVAHSGELAAFAVTGRHAVGVDLEYVRSDIDTASVARSFFSPAERVELETMPPALRQPAFFAGWVRKEAFMKALGFGLSLGSEQFDVSLSPVEAGRVKRLPPGVSPEWRLYDFASGGNYRGAVAVPGPPAPVRIHGP